MNSFLAPEATDRFPDFDPAAPAAVLECQARIAERQGSLPAPHGLLAHSPALAQAFVALSAALWQGQVPHRVLEGLFLLNAQRQQCRYQWVRHVDKARAAGLAPAVIDRLALGREPAGADDPAFHAAWQLATALQSPGPVDDALFARLQQHYGVPAIAELTAFCGFASMVSNALRVRQPGLPEGSAQPPF